MRGSNPTAINRVPAKAEIQRVVYNLRVRIWVPACAGNKDCGGRKQVPLRRYAPLPPKGEDIKLQNLPPLGEVPAQPG